MTTPDRTIPTAPPCVPASVAARVAWWVDHPDALLERLRRPAVERWVPVQIVEAEPQAPTVDGDAR